MSVSSAAPTDTTPSVPDVLAGTAQSPPHARQPRCFSRSSETEGAGLRFAARRGPGREFSIVLHRAEDQVRLEVRDSGPGQPSVQQAADDACSGRGLHLVRELADDFGVDDHVVGKTVWLVFKTSATTAALP
ncbi:ATP-binding protein [Streptomyces sp. NPDC091040]|uniref:ATP-binding protein n=1 Tax=Streptomyces sp. NPDC091040 TaxID=3365972 RepID=UPI00382DD644